MSKAKRRVAAVASNPSVSLRWVGTNGLLLMAVLASAVAVIETTHQCRQFYANLQALQAAEWKMQEVWSQLILQEGSVANHDWVETAATARLDMRAPAVAETRVVLR